MKSYIMDGLHYEEGDRVFFVRGLKYPLNDDRFKGKNIFDITFQDLPIYIDKELYEKGKIGRVKAGVLSEDAVWNLLTHS